MDTGVTTDQLNPATLVDSILANRNGSTVLIELIPFLALLTALLGPSYATRAELYADLNWPAGAPGYVRGDATTAYNGVYKKAGVHGAGSWARIGDLPSGAIEGPQLAALEDAIELLAPRSSPALTGSPTAPTAAPGTSNTMLANTAFVQAEINALIAAAPGTLNTLNELAAALGDDPNYAASMAALIGAKAPMNSPVLTGTPTAPTPEPGASETQIATVKTINERVAPESRQSSTPGRIVAGWKHGKYLALGFDEATGEIILGGVRLGVGADGLLQVRGEHLAGGVGSDGYLRGVAGPQLIEDGWGAFPIPGTPQAGAVQNVRFNGMLGHYDAEDGRGQRRFYWRGGQTQWAAHMMLTTSTRAFASRRTITGVYTLGQSWPVRENTTDEVRLTNPRMADRLEAYVNNEVVEPALGPGWTGPALPWSPLTYPEKQGYQLGIAPKGFRQWRPAGTGHMFRLGEIAAATYAELMRWSGQTRHPVMAWTSGWSGQNWPAFLDGAGPGVTYTPPGGSPTTVAPALIDGEVFGMQTEYLWQRDLTMRAQLEALARDQWGCGIDWPFMLWVQWPDEIDGAYLAFLTELRAQMTRAGITSRLIIDQMAALTSDTYAGEGPMDQLQFAQANASGKDHMAGPRWPWRMEDNTHHCSEDAVRYGEVQGQAMYHLTRWGAWEPLWMKAVTFPSANVARFVINRPRQIGDNLLTVDEKFIGDAHRGFSLRGVSNPLDAGTDSPIGITGVTFGALNSTTLFADVTADGPLSGSIRCGFAAHGIAQPTGTTGAPSRSACVGAVRAKSSIESGLRTQGEIGPFSEVEIPQFLSTYNLIHTN